MGSHGTQTVVLGPRFDLHPGIHGSLQADPPPGVFYYARGGRHHFAFDGEPAGEPACAPFHYPHHVELVSFGPGPQVVHSARWPVADRRAWVADTDDFGYPMLLGRHLFRVYGSSPEEAWSGELQQQMAKRAENMLAAFAHPSCKAVLFRTRRALEEGAEWIRKLRLEEEGRAFLAKSRVLYPAQRACLPAVVDQKWESEEGLRVLFVGKDYEVKNGRLALRVFRRLAERHPGARFTYVGQVPEEELHLAEGLDFRGQLPRADVLRLFRESHVLFHPARDESFGMVYLEAAANGLATVTARGRGLRHLEEIVDARQALLLDRDTVAPEDEEEAFHGLLGRLLAEPALARSLGLASFERATEGDLSLEARNRALGAIYREAAEDPAPDGVTPALLPHWEGCHRLSLHSDELSVAVKTYLDREGIRKSNFYFRGSDPAVNRSATLPEERVALLGAAG